MKQETDVSVSVNSVTPLLQTQSSKMMSIHYQMEGKEIKLIILLVQGGARAQLHGKSKYVARSTVEKNRPIIKYKKDQINTVITGSATSFRNDTAVVDNFCLLGSVTEQKETSNQEILPLGRVQMNVQM